jgi:hypothetical protein
LGDAGVQDEGVRRAVLFRQGQNGIIGGLPVGQIEADQDGLGSSALDNRRGHLAGGVLADPVVEPDSEAGLGEGERHRRADPSTRSGDEGLFHGPGCSSRRSSILHARTE